MLENLPRYTGFGEFDALTLSDDEGDIAVHRSAAELSYDVHDMWRSSLSVGDTTPFAPDYVTIEELGDSRDIDIANTAPEKLPAAVKGLSYVTATIVSGMVDTHLRSGQPLDDMRIEKLATTLYMFWDVIKRDEPLSRERIRSRSAGYMSESERVKVLDLRIILAGFASLLDDDRFPMWQRNHDMEQVRAIPGVHRYANQGRSILHEVSLGRPVPLHSPADNLR
jgi:hypothetical protein